MVDSSEDGGSRKSSAATDWRQMDQSRKVCGIYPPLIGILFAEFDTTLGPVIRHQIPDGLISKDSFNLISSLVITKKELWKHLLKINMHDYKIMGYPVGIEHKKYGRNALMFNVCFVVLNVSDGDYVYEPLVTKLVNYLIALEQEDYFLSNESLLRVKEQTEGVSAAESQQKLPGIMRNILNDLNRFGSCAIEVNPKTTIYLKINPLNKEPPPVDDFMVPVMVTSISNTIEWEHFGAVTRRILNLIDGYVHVGRIIEEIDIDESLVKNTVQNLVVRGMVVMIPMFEYCNRYAVTNGIHKVFQDPILQQECVDFVQFNMGPPASPQLTAPKFADIFRLYCSLKPGMSMKDWCLRHSPHSVGVDDRKLIQFGLMRKFVRKVSAYPVWTGGKDGEKPTKPLEKCCNGTVGLEELCRKFREFPKISTLLHTLEANPNIVVIWK